MSRHRSLRLACATAIVATLATLIPASAHVVTPNSIERRVVRHDGNDTRSPLDIRTVEVVHVGPAVDTVYLTAWNPVTDLELSPSHHGNFGVGIDTNDRPRR